MRTRLKAAPTVEDLYELGEIERRLQALLCGMNPAAACHAPLFAAIATVQACGAEWSGDASIWRTRDSIRVGAAYDPKGR